MQETAIADFIQYQQHVVRAYRCLQRRDRDEYTGALVEANRVLQDARRQLSSREFAVFQGAAQRTVDVLRKCLALGLQNMEKRLAEFRLVEALAVRLPGRKGASSVSAHAQQHRTRQDNGWLLAA